MATGLTLVGCGHVSPVRPVSKGELEVRADLGGPVASWSIPFPAPHLSAGVAYGVSEGLDVSAHLHLSPLITGVAGLDIGASGTLSEEAGALPALVLSGTLYGFTNLQGVAGYLDTTLTASWSLFNDRVVPYVAGTVFAQGGGGRSLVVPSIGAQLWFGKLGLQIEGQWIQPDLETRYQAVPWVGIGGRGALSVVMRMRWRGGWLQ